MLHSVLPDDFTLGMNTQGGESEQRKGGICDYLLFFELSVNLLHSQECAGDRERSDGTISDE